MICSECGREIFPETNEAGLEHNKQFHSTAEGGINWDTKEIVFK